MLNHPLAISSQPRRYLLAAPLTLALLLSQLSAHAQVVPRPEPARKSLRAEPIYYVDGKLTTQSRFSKLDQRLISDINVLKGDAESKTFGSTTNGGTILVTTKANANSPAVLAFTKRIQRAVPLLPASPEQEAAVAAAASYVTQAYPTAKLEAVHVLQTLPASYKAVFMENTKRVSLLFDGSGQVIKR